MDVFTILINNTTNTIIDAAYIARAINYYDSSMNAVGYDVRLVIKEKEKIITT